MSSPKKTEKLLIKRLNSNVEAVDSNASETFEEAKVEVSRIDLQGNLGVGQESKVFFVMGKD
jgi:hypothetical protein